MWRVRVIEGGTKFPTGQSHKIWGNFQKFALKFINICKIIAKFREKVESFRKFFKFSGGA